MYIQFTTNKTACQCQTETSSLINSIVTFCPGIYLHLMSFIHLAMYTIVLPKVLVKISNIYHDFFLGLMSFNC